MTNYRRGYRQASYRPNGGYRIGAYQDGDPSTGSVFVPAGPSFPVQPLLSFGAQNFDGTNNSSLVDGGAISSWYNTGSLGTGNNAAQATGANQFAFKLNAGVLGSFATAQAVDANRFMTTTITPVAQAYTVGCIVRGTKAATQVYLSTGSGPVSEFYMSTTTDHIQAGTDVDSALTATANQFHMRVIVVNGASSFVRLDGVQSANLGAGANAFGNVSGLVTLMRDLSSLGVIGYGAEFQIWSGTPSVAGIESAYTGYYGSFPQ